MMLSPRLRWALGLTLLACLGVALMEPADEPVRPVAAARRGAAAPAKPASVPTAAGAWPERPTRIDAPAWAAVGEPVLAAWSPAVAPAAAAASAPLRVVAAAPVPPAPPPAAPVAPPFPYQLIGRFDDGSAAQALLLGADRTLGVRAGDLVDGQWRVDAVDAAGVSLTWMPAGLRQTLTFRPS